MSHQFIFLCPNCQAEDSIVKSGCSRCGSTIIISSNNVSVDDRNWRFPELLQWMRDSIPVFQPADKKHPLLKKFFPRPWERPFRISQQATLRQGRERIRFIGYGNSFTRFLEKAHRITDGYLLIKKDSFYFLTPEKKYEYALEDLTCVTTDSHYFEFKVKGQPYFQIHFHTESPLKYEIIFQKLLEIYYAHQKQTIIEFQPKLRFRFPSCRKTNVPLTKKVVSSAKLQDITAGIVRFFLKILFLIMVKIEIYGRVRVPNEYPFVAILNHQSIFDPFIVLTFLDKRIAFLTKSTSFTNRLEGFFLKIGRGIPTTRYQIDPMVISHIRKFLSGGIPVGIFPEAERSWDGEMNAFKVSVIRLLAQLQIPVVPVHISNTFSFFPRWAKLPRRTKIRMTVHPAFSLLPKNHSCKDLKQFIENAVLQASKELK